LDVIAYRLSKAFTNVTKIELPKNTITTAFCSEWGVQSGVFQIPSNAWDAFTLKLKMASSKSLSARKYNGIICDSVLKEFEDSDASGTISEHYLQHEGVVWVIDKNQRQVLWEVWF